MLHLAFWLRQSIFSVFISWESCTSGIQSGLRICLAGRTHTSQKIIFELNLTLIFQMTSSTNVSLVFLLSIATSLIPLVLSIYILVSVKGKSFEEVTSCGIETEKTDEKFPPPYLVIGSEFKISSLWTGGQRSQILFADNFWFYSFFFDERVTHVLISFYWSST
jgi:hypothetical protein